MWLMKIIQANSIPNGGATNPRTPKIYTGIAQGADPKGYPVADCWLHGLKLSLDYNSINFT